MGPPNPQTPADRLYLESLFPLFKKLPPNFEFPLAVDPSYRPKSNSLYVLITGIFACSITVAAVASRLWIRSKGKFGVDDWVLIAAFANYSVFNCVNLVGVTVTGLGYHLYDLSHKDIHSALVIQYLHTVFWTLALHLTRCSVLHLLLRLTPALSLFRRRFLQSVLIASYAFLILNLGLLIFECQPVGSAFDLKSRLDGKCIGSTSIAEYGALCAGHIALDLLTIVPPIPIIARLPMARAKKINLFVLLTLGLITIILTSVRMFVFYEIMVSSFDITRNAIAIGEFGILESSLAMTIACLPVFNRNLVAYGRRLFGYRSTTSGSGSDPNSGQQPQIYKGPAKYVSYTVDATAQGSVRTYVELQDVQSQDQLNPNLDDGKGSDKDITVQRTFDVSAETVSVIENREENERIDGPSSPKASRLCLFSGLRCKQTTPPPGDNIGPAQ